MNTSRSSSPRRQPVGSTILLCMGTDNCQTVGKVSILRDGSFRPTCRQQLKIFTISGAAGVLFNEVSLKDTVPKSLQAFIADGFPIGNLVWMWISCPQDEQRHGCMPSPFGASQFTQQFAHASTSLNFQALQLGVTTLSQVSSYDSWRCLCFWWLVVACGFVPLQQTHLCRSTCPPGYGAVFAIGLSFIAGSSSLTPEAASRLPVSVL